MDILDYSGIPGSGKTLDGTYEALRHFRKENSKLKKFVYILCSKIPGKIGNKSFSKLEYYKIFPYGKINNVYSSYPILLDKKRQIYSNKWSIYDFNNKWSFYPNALFIDDEIQLKVDSDEYKDKEKNDKISYIAKFMQAARHFGCNKIILCTQHPSRLFKKARNVVSGFVQHKSMFIIPIINIGFIKTITYYTLEDYGKYIPKDRQERKKLTFEYKKKTKFMNFNKVFKAYDSRYLSNYNYNKPLINKGTYDSLKVDYNDLLPYFEGDLKEPLRRKKA